MTSAAKHRALMWKIPRRKLLFAILVMALAVSVRLLMWQDNHDEAHLVETMVTADYKDSAQQLFNGDLRAFVSDVNHMEHPPGYAILLAGIFRAFGDSDKAIQFTRSSRIVRPYCLCF